MNTLLLASKSTSRTALLTQAKVPFTIISQDADERACDWTLPIQQLVASIASHKMEHAILPAGKEGDLCFVVTADTLVQDDNGNIHGQPLTHENAIVSLKALQNGSSVCTAFRLDKKIMQNNQWQTVATEYASIIATCDFVIPDNLIETYLQKEPLALKCAGAMVVEGYGQQFIKTISGSYSAIIGLPLYELRIALEKLGFF